MEMPMCSYLTLFSCLSTGTSNIRASLRVSVSRRRADCKGKGSRAASVRGAVRIMASWADEIHGVAPECITDFSAQGRQCKSENGRCWKRLERIVSGMRDEKPIPQRLKPGLSLASMSELKLRP